MHEGEVKCLKVLKSGKAFAFIFAVIPLFGSMASMATAQELVVYSGRGERLIKPVFDEFTKRTGIKIILHSAGTVELFNKLLAEGDRTLLIFI